MSVAGSMDASFKGAGHELDQTAALGELAC